MARNARHSDMQVEVASGLRRVVEDSQLGSALCTPEFLAPLRRLLCADSFGIVYPTACVLHGIAKCPDVARRFLGEGCIELIDIASTIQGKLENPSTDRDVGVLLAKSLLQFVRHCPRRQDVSMQLLELAASVKKLLEQETVARVDQIRSCLRATLRACT